MNTFQDAIDLDGPVVRVAINMPAAFLMQMRRQAQPIPPAVEVMALIDTGADVSVFDPSVFVPLQPYGLVAGQALYVNAPGLGPITPVFEYFVSLEFPVGPPNPVKFEMIAVVERALGAMGYQALLGRDVLAACGFWYDGPGGRFTLAF